MSPPEDLPSSLSLEFIEEVYATYQTDPASVDEQWCRFFEALKQDSSPLIDEASETREPAASVGRITPQQRVDILEQMSLFARMTPDELREVVKITREADFGPGEYLCREGEEGNDLFVIVDGTVQIRRDGRLATEVGVGEVVGELSVLDRRPRSADVIAKDTVSALRIGSDEFQGLLARRTNLALNLLQVMVGRLRERSHQQARVDQLVRAYRVRGHVRADLDPLGRRSGHHPDLTLEQHGLSDRDLDISFATDVGGRESVRPLREILEHLDRTYCRATGVQYMHIDDLAVQRWLRERLEDPARQRELERDEQIRILTKLTDAEVFEVFLHRKFVGAKRFSLEGAESLIPLLDMAIEEAGQNGFREVVMGMAHRGRLNVLVNVLDKPARQVFREFEDVDPELYGGQGDVKYHLGYSSNRMTTSGAEVHLSLCFNPSHLEFVGPVVLGRTRAKQDRHGDVERKRGLPIIIHGDAAIAGQGVVQELLNLSELPGYTTGGAVHIVVNNQIGFTTSPDDSRSSQYATDVARMLQIPIFHVNGERPGAVARVVRLAMDFRSTFNKDVFIDMYSYRRHGHNEGDEPSFTQPLEYKLIKKRPSVRAAYVENLLKLGEITSEEADHIAEQSRDRLEAHLAEARRPVFDYRSEPKGAGLWRPYVGGCDRNVPEVPTSVPRQTLIELFEKLTVVPDGFHPNRKISKFIENRKEMIRGERELDWGAAEALALASLANEGFRIRLGGQDARRGTFSHRHAALVDQETGQEFVSLQHLGANQGPVDVINSPLSETGVLGFEYGYSLDCPDSLVVWEAQFGDFINVSQVIIDQFISSSEDKWSRLSGLCLLLPHGFEGQGPEHSSARLERFLMLAAEDNIQVVNPTTPAQFFHCLRRQVVRTWRKPLVVMSPKSLLRHPACTSTLAELAEGSFHRVIPETEAIDPAGVRRVLLCSGKVYYDLIQARRASGIEDVAIVRLEQYYPLAREDLAPALERYPLSTPVVWVQEEPMNMGAWPFLRLRLGQSVEGNGSHPLSVQSRPASASPATGSAAAHRIEQAQLVERALSVQW